MTKRTTPLPPTHKPYTVVSRTNEDGSFPKVEWFAAKGTHTDMSPFCKGALSIARVTAMDQDDAILQARQKQGLEALLKRIAKHKGTENVE